MSEPVLILHPQNIIHTAYASVCLLGILLVNGKPQFKALVLLLVCQACHQVFNFVEDINIFPVGFIITPAFQLAYGPLYYLFVKNIVYGRIALSKELPHFIPFFAGLFLTHWWWQELVVGFALLLLYLALSFRLLRRYERTMAELTATDEQFNFRWVQVVFALIGVIKVVSYSRMSLQPFLSISILIPWYYLDLLLGLTYFTYLIVKAARQAELYTGLGELEIISEKRKPAEGGQKDQAGASELFSAIEAYMNESKRYLQQKYSLRNLSEEMELSEQMTSWAINQGGGVSFSDYINGKRLDQIVDSMQASNGNFNILQNAMKAGFSSKSTFNAAFRRRFGGTPSDYLKKTSKNR